MSSGDIWGKLDSFGGVKMIQFPLTLLVRLDQVVCVFVFGSCNKPETHPNHFFAQFLHAFTHYILTRKLSFTLEMEQRTDGLP